MPDELTATDTTIPAADTATETAGADQANPTADPTAADGAAPDTGKQADTGSLLGDPDDGGKEADGDGKDEKASGAPDEYQDFTVPEGVPVDQAGMDAFKGVAKELGLTQEQAQRLVSMQAERVQHLADEQAAAWAKQQEDWQSAVRADQEIGGTEMAARVGVAKQPIAKFGSPALQKVLTETGLGNHPELVRFAYRVGRAIADDTVDVPAGGQGRERTAAVLYDNSDMK